MIVLLEAEGQQQLKTCRTNTKQDILNALIYSIWHHSKSLFHLNSRKNEFKTCALTGDASSPTADRHSNVAPHRSMSVPSRRMLSSVSTCRARMEPFHKFTNQRQLKQLHLQYAKQFQM